MLITFEGIDGCGKSTQISLLKEALEAEGRPVQLYREPGGSELSEAIRELLLNSTDAIHPVAEILLFSAARAQLVREKIEPALEQGTIVILDRFYDSTTAYQGYGRESLSLPDVEQLNRLATNALEPDLTVYLKLSQKQAKERLKQSSPDRMERAGDSFFEKVIRGYDELSKIHPRFLVVDANRPVEVIHEEILAHVTAFRQP
ncbi:MAG: dTMP kinase [Balneolaceae bacterium]